MVYKQNNLYSFYFNGYYLPCDDWVLGKREGGTILTDTTNLQGGEDIQGHESSTPRVKGAGLKDKDDGS